MRDGQEIFDWRPIFRDRHVAIHTRLVVLHCYILSVPLWNLQNWAVRVYEQNRGIQKVVLRNYIEVNRDIQQEILIINQKLVNTFRNIRYHTCLGYRHIFEMYPTIENKQDTTRNRKK